MSAARENQTRTPTSDESPRNTEGSHRMLLALAILDEQEVNRGDRVGRDGLGGRLRILHKPKRRGEPVSSPGRDEPQIDLLKNLMQGSKGSGEAVKEVKNRKREENRYPRHDPAWPSAR